MFFQKSLVIELCTKQMTRHLPWYLISKKKYKKFSDLLALEDFSVFVDKKGDMFVLII
jgi:hypothetical protein